MSSHTRASASDGVRGSQASGVSRQFTARATWLSRSIEFTGSPSLTKYARPPTASGWAARAHTARSNACTRFPMWIQSCKPAESPTAMLVSPHRIMRTMRGKCLVSFSPKMAAGRNASVCTSPSAAP
eukprot:6195709-Pleurochrysis_carterae.AAC.5